MKCADTVLKVLPHFCDALVVKFNVHQTFGNAYVQRYGRVPSHFIKNNHQEYEDIINTLDSLGYSQQSDEEYEQRVEEALKEQ